MHSNSKIVENKFSLPQEKYSKTYFLEVRQNVVSMDESSTNVITLEVEKEFIKKDDFGCLFSVVVVDRKQSNIDSLRGLEHFLSKLQEKIILYTDENGNIKSIVNQAEIKEKWIDCKRVFLKKFKDTNDISGIADRLTDVLEKKEDVLNLFRQSEVGTLLFPPIYFSGLNENKTVLQNKFYRDFFGPYVLPYLMKTRLIKSNDISKTKVARTGEIDKKILEEDQIKLYYRRLHGTYNLMIDIESTYTEIFDLDSSNIIETAFQLFGVKVGDIYSFDQITTVKS